MAHKFTVSILSFVVFFALIQPSSLADVGPPTDGVVKQAEATQTPSPAVKQPAKLPVELIVQALKVKAEKALAEKRKREAWQINVDVDAIEKYETNPSLDKSRNSDWSTTEDASLTIKKHIYGSFTGQYDYYGSNSHYNDYRDNNSFSNSSKGSLLTDLPWELSNKVSYEFEHLYYPFARDSTVFSQRVKEEITWGPAKWFTQKAWWQFQDQQNLNREQKVRVAGSNVKLDNRRHDSRQEAGFEETFRKSGWTFKMSDEFYRNWSNDHALGEPFDKWFFKMKYTLSRNITKKLSADVVYAYDRTIFLKKNVTGKNEDQVDDGNEFSSTWTYKLSKRWKIKYKFKYKGKGSNNDSLEYENYTNQMGVYFSY